MGTSKDQITHLNHSEVSSPITPSSPFSSSSPSTPKPKYIYELPYNVRKAFCDLMDADGSWKHLGGIFMKLNDTQLTLISHALYRGASPTNDLLLKWEQTNPQINQLFNYLYCMKHIRAMTIIKPFVDTKLQELCDEDLVVNNIDPKQNNGNAFLFEAGPNCENVKTGKPNLDGSKQKKLNNHEWNDLGSIVNSSKNYNQGDKLSNKSVAGKPADSSNKHSNCEDELEVPYKELLLSTDNFSDERIIGSGGFGVVYKGLWKGTHVAIKRFKGVENA